MGSLSLDRYHFYFLMISKKVLTFLSLSNPVLPYWSFDSTEMLPHSHRSTNCHDPGLPPPTMYEKLSYLVNSGFVDNALGSLCVA